MANLNKVILIGNLTRDPETKSMPSGTMLATMRLATNRTYTDSKGQKQEETTFIDVDVWGKQAEVISKYMKKGRQILIEGRLKLDEWKDKESGKNRSQIRIVCENFQFIDSNGKKDNKDSSVDGEVNPLTESSEDNENYNKSLNNLTGDNDIKKALREFAASHK